MAQLIFLGHFPLVAALSHRGGGLRRLIRLPQVVALSTELWSVLHHRTGLRFGGLHRIGSVLLAIFGCCWRCLGKTQFAALNARGGIAVCGLQRDFRTPAWIVVRAVDGA